MCCEKPKTVINILVSIAT